MCRNLIALPFFTICLLATGSLVAAEIRGHVARVAGKTVTVTTKSEGSPAKGDKVEFLVKIPGIGEAQVGTGVVTEVKKDFILIEIKEASGKVEIGHLARITLAKKGGEPAPKPSSPTTTTKDGMEFPSWPGIKPDQPWLGVSRWWANQREIVLCGVLQDGPAGKAGLRTDDTILSIDGTEIHNTRDFHNAIDSGKPAVYGIGGQFVMGPRKNDGLDVIF